MSKLRYVFLSMNVLNCLLLVAVTAVAYYTVIPFLYIEEQMTLPQAAVTAPAEEGKPAQIQSLSPMDYAVISDQNLFHPERKVPPEQADEKMAARPDVVLYGTMIINDISFAFVEDRRSPYSTPGRGKRQIALKKGDKLSGYTLQQIEPDHIVLVKGEDKIIVRLNDTGKKRGDGSAAAQPASPTGVQAPAIPPAQTGFYPARQRMRSP